MSHAHFSRPSLLRRALLQALVASLIPLGTAFAQSGSLVRVAGEKTEITSRTHTKGDVLMTPPLGTVLEVIDTEGDRYIHRKSNWYWVVLPRDSWGTRRVGWISGRDVEHVPPPETAKAAPASETGLAGVQREQPGNEQSKIAGGVDSELPKPALQVVPTAAADQPEICEVILHFRFAKSDLTDEAKGQLASAVAMLKVNAQGVSFALEGHADWTGPEAFNERLGLARAETVKRYLAEQYEIPINRISVVSYGENNPVASNATREGRAQNRRVVVKVKA